MLKKSLLYIALIFTIGNVDGQTPLNKVSFAPFNLSGKGLEKVGKAESAGKFAEAAMELLAYYRNRPGALTPKVGKRINPALQQLADDILKHKFKPHKGYPTFEYGENINWQFRPVQDQLLTTFLHRTTFWESLGNAYLATGNEKYAKEWIFQVRDWLKKNKQGAYADDKEFAWKAFVVSFRLNNWATFFNQFINSPHFTPQFLMEFLNAYNEQANYVMANYTDIGNHRLYEAEHLLLAGTSFPEFKDAAIWRKSGIDVLNSEIGKQVYDDGMQFELSTSYHIGTIGTFLRALKMAKIAGIENEFPQKYRDLVEKMTTAVPKFSFPDYTFPLYGNSFLTDKATMLKNYAAWADVFPKNKMLAYFASDGAKGEKPGYLSSALPQAGFYAFRNGWDMKSTVLQLKAGPPAEFHAHPDNGNFVLWVKGRDFTPDAGSFIYANIGVKENAKRDWYRSTMAHQTLTLNNQNIEINKASAIKWETGSDIERLTYTNPSYKSLNHQRTFLFIDQTYFLIIDRAIGDATGKLDVRYVLKEDAKPEVDQKNLQLSTTYNDGNNLFIKLLNSENAILKPEESFVSYVYQKEQPRPAFAFEKQKNTIKTVSFISLLYPFQEKKAPNVKLSENASHDLENGMLDISLEVNGKVKLIKMDLKIE
ncbi:alginate lyase family protein [Pedobacter sp. MC2016-05]|uniref:heparin-sulfate lyase HepC n=1 Tax=Pedobacter sp. MC2016-05 TaxID=2994474 RepID=UPI0022457A68|nr:heparin-sulfate lyase HepC [Pedobacter sp. MC2016-05]MCX2477012.1 alginate lyase family protein [Pedobacter sp. MC2016-05]